MIERAAISTAQFARALPPGASPDREGPWRNLSRRSYSLLKNRGYFPLPVFVCPVLAAEVPVLSPETVLFEPGTTVVPVAPGARLSFAAAEGIGAFTPGFTSAVPMPGFCVLSTFVPVDVSERLDPMLPVGLLPWAIASIGVANKATVINDIHNLEFIIRFLFWLLDRGHR